MDAKILTALRGSIEKWQRIVDGTGEDYGSNNCPLCHVFLDSDCEGCPVFHRSGKRFCRGTPYSDYRSALNNLLDAEDIIAMDGPGKVDLTDAQSAMAAAARAELAFLKSLLPERPATVETRPTDGDGCEVMP